ncbi:ribonuclease III [Coprinopsis marcescibilis]|uniref:Ribonuclease III n=1 Tax=Coprinopsis marcescibilis TaxID=230819 RepID=A0A5C3L847_COPMA|nr:ribonuclease III [Coprinopsis marcescibilis]
MKLEPDFGPNNVNFPPLPQIMNPYIEQQVFTHRSYHARPTNVFEDHPDDLSPDNERYEHLGDTVVGLIVTNLILDMFPGLRVGPSTKIRSLVVGNTNLAEISKRYRLPDRLRLHHAQAITLRASTNIQADVFESFVGGLFRDQGLSAVQRWLNPLLRPFAKEAYMCVRKQHSLPPLPPSSQSLAMNGQYGLSASASGNANGWGESDSHDDGYGAVGPTVGHLALFNQQLQRTNRQVEWIYSDGQEPLGTTTTIGTATTHTGATDGGEGNKENKWYSDPGVPAHLRIKGTQVTPVWYVKVLVDGEFYGRGRGNTKRVARNEAAKEGLIKLGIDV